MPHEPPGANERNEAHGQKRPCNVRSVVQHNLPSEQLPITFESAPHLEQLFEVRQQLFTQLLVERVREELREVGQLLDDVQVEVAMIAQLQQQGAHRRVHDLHVHLEPRDELQRKDVHLSIRT